MTAATKPTESMTSEVEALAAVVADLQDELNRSDRAVAHELGVGGAEDLQVLRLLSSAPLRVGDLARRRSTSFATASARLDRLEKRGLVARGRTDDDRRAVVAELTRSGRRAAERSTADRLAALAGVARDFPVDALRRLVGAVAPDGSRPTT